MTTTHVDFDSSKPAGSSSPTTYAADDLDNLRALRDMIIAGLVPGFVQSRTNGTGTANQPQYITWYNSALGVGFRWNITWTSFNPTTIQEEWTNDSGAAWISVGSAQVNTFDGSNNVTASTNSGGFVNVLLEVWGKLLRVISDAAAHIAGTGTGVHGLGSMATQSASAVVITGGTVEAAVGQTTPKEADATRLREKFNDYGTIGAGATVTFEVDKYAHVACTPNATTSNTMIVALSGVAASGKSQTITIEIVNGQRSADAKITWPASFKWIGGAATRPVDTALELSGRNLFVATTRDGGTRWEITHLGKGG